MKKYVIEREMKGVGNSTDQDLGQAAEKSNKVLAELGNGIHWLESFVVGDKIYCIYVADNEDLIRTHAKLSGFPADRISAVRAVLDPSTAAVR